MRCCGQIHLVWREILCIFRARHLICVCKADLSVKWRAQRLHVVQAA
jgi:hypothetical protein